VSIVLAMRQQRILLLSANTEAIACPTKAQSKVTESNAVLTFRELPRYDRSEMAWVPLHKCLFRRRAQLHWEHVLAMAFGTAMQGGGDEMDRFYRVDICGLGISFQPSGLPSDSQPIEVS
jgi:hypothetical protein